MQPSSDSDKEVKGQFLQCLQGHDLLFNSTEENDYYCNECILDIDIHTEIRECDECNYSICMPCSRDILRTRYVQTAAERLNRINEQTNQAIQMLDYKSFYFEMRKGIQTELTQKVMKSLMTILYGPKEYFQYNLNFIRDLKIYNREIKLKIQGKGDFIKKDQPKENDTIMTQSQAFSMIFNNADINFLDILKVSHNSAYLVLWAKSFMEEAIEGNKIEAKLIKIRLKVHEMLPQWAIKLIDKHPINEFWLEIDKNYDPNWKNEDFTSIKVYRQYYKKTIKDPEHIYIGQMKKIPNRGYNQFGFGIELWLEYDMIKYGLFYKNKFIQGQIIGRNNRGRYYSFEGNFKQGLVESSSGQYSTPNFNCLQTKDQDRLNFQYFEKNSTLAYIEYDVEMIWGDYSCSQIYPHFATELFKNNVVIINYGTYVEPNPVLPIDQPIDQFLVIPEIDTKEIMIDLTIKKDNK